MSGNFHCIKILCCGIPPTLVQLVSATVAFLFQGNCILAHASVPLHFFLCFVLLLSLSSLYSVLPSALDLLTNLVKIEAPQPNSPMPLTCFTFHHSIHRLPILCPYLPTEGKLHEGRVLVCCIHCCIPVPRT